MSWSFLKTILQYILPQKSLSRLVGKLANCEHPLLKNWLIDKFIAYYAVDMSDAIETDPHCYKSFNEFFILRLKLTARPLAEGENTIASPVDGMISELGDIQDQALLQAKGMYYDLTALLGGDAKMAALFQGGQFINMYLAPKDYHRIHMPLAGKLKCMIHVPGKLFSVNTATAENVPNLFTRNERVICLFDTVAGPMAVVLVGAMIVASIHTVWAGLVAPAGKQPAVWHYEDRQENSLDLARGEELGHFELGSTVIVLFAKDALKWSPSLQAGQPVQFGQKVAELVK